MSTESNVESLLKAILTGDEEYIVVPQSRVEELLLAIYKNGGGGGGGGTAGIKYLGVIDDYKNLSTTAKKGDYYLAGTADKYKNIHVGDMLIAQKDSPAATIDNSNYRLLHTELDTDTTYTITQDSKDAHIFYFKASTETGTGTKITIPDNDTKTTAASDEKSATKLYLVGTMTQDATGVKTYANAKIYIGTDNCLYSNGEKVALQSDVDKKVNKTSVSSGENSTTSVINVTDAKAQMAMVAKISGKTVKTKNLFDMSKVTTATASGVTFTVSGDAMTINGTSSANYSSCFKQVLDHTNNKTLTSGKTYTVSIKPEGATNSNVALYLYTNTGSGYVINGNSGSDKLTFTFSSTWTEWLIRVGVKNSGVSISNYKIHIQIEEGSTVTAYEPYFEGLHSAAVESVVSQGVNMADSSTITRETLNETGAALASTTRCVTDYIRVKPSSTLKVSLENALIFEIHEYTYSKGFIKFTTVNAVSTSITLGATTGYVRILMRKSSNADILPSEIIKLLCTSNGSTAYVPYNKTTVLVPSAVKNLPDYGCSVGDIANEVDFENGVYNLNVKSITGLEKMTWNVAGEGDNCWYSSELTDAAEYSDLLCSRYNHVQYNDIGKTDKSITTVGRISIIHDSAYSDTASFKNSLVGVEVIYKLGNSSKRTIPLTDFIRPLPVENGGTLTLVNEHNLDMPSVIKYKKEV